MLGACRGERNYRFALVELVLLARDVPRRSPASPGIPTWTADLRQCALPAAAGICSRSCLWSEVSCRVPAGFCHHRRGIHSSRRRSAPSAAKPVVYQTGQLFINILHMYLLSYFQCNNIKYLIILPQKAGFVKWGDICCLPETESSSLRLTESGNAVNDSVMLIRADFRRSGAGVFG